MPERDNDLINEARAVEESIPGVSVTDEAHDQVRMDETSDLEQTPAGEQEMAGPETDYKDLFLRERAEAENFRKRMIKKQTDILEYANEELARSMLQVLDHFHLAIAHGEASDGVKLAFKELTDVLAGFGLQEIEVDEGVPFDPSLHHALTTMPDTAVDEDTVKQVHRRGYRFKDHVLRAPEVVVAQPMEQKEEG